MAQSPAKFELAHGELGRLVGIPRGEDIVQFRGIPFADIPGRFRQSVLRTELPSGNFDATKTGAACPQQFLPYPDFWTVPLPGDSWQPSLPKQEEFGCLNLNITAPREPLETGVRLPVLVFIHGGAFIGGSHGVQVAGREIYDATELVRDSLTRGRNVVVVTINYRVGPLGFLASTELDEYNRSRGEAVGNYGLHDQRRALEWVSRYIGGFGGNPDNITIQGSSAGGSSCHYQSIFPDRKFRRAILASGTITGIGPKSLNQHQATFDEFKDKFAQRQASNSEIIQCLQAVAVETFVSAIPLSVCNPLIDGEWVPSGYLDGIGQIENPPDLMAGSCAFEQEIGDFLLRDRTTMKVLPRTKMLQQARSMFDTSGLLSSPEKFPFEYPAVLQSYAVDHNDHGEGSEIQYWAKLISDVTFRIPPLHLALSQHTSRVFVYDFQATNPFPSAGLAYGKANHAVNDLFFFDVARDVVPEQHQSDWAGAVDQLRGVWLDFCYGTFHWEPMKKSHISSGDDLGPVYTFVNGGKGMAAPLTQAVSDSEATRWTEVLRISR